MTEMPCRRDCFKREESTGGTAYQAMMYGVERTDVDARTAWAQSLRQYCRLDTRSMVLVFEYWRRRTV